MRCYARCVAVPDLQKLLQLDIETRLALVQELWDSIADEAQNDAGLPVSDAERELLAERLREDDENPDAAISWEEARAHLHRTR
jgi:putative addiction module component (TIGR02574 family)